MEHVPRQDRSHATPRQRHVLAGIVPLLLFIFPLDAAPQAPGGTDTGGETEGDTARLRRYDLAGPEWSEDAPVTDVLEKAVEETPRKLSFFTRLWELDEEARRGSYAITTHRSNYILPFTYNNVPNIDAVREADPDKELRNAEVAFQLSLKVKLWQDILGQKMDLWFGYTQRSFWQLYNVEDSSPFRETDYEPEVLLNFRTRYRVLGFDGRFVNVGFNHQSNGQSEPLSRSWNRIVGSLGVERKDLSLLLKGWYRFPESDHEDDNPNIEDYIGYGELWAYYFWRGHRLGVMVRNNFNFHTNRGSLQAEWSFPLIKRVSGYVQYYTGYGESLLDYDHSVNRIGFGVIIRGWD